MKNISAKDLWENYITFSKYLEEYDLSSSDGCESKAVTLSRIAFLEEIISHCDEELATCDTMSSEESIYHADKVLDIKDKVSELLSICLFRISETKPMSPVEIWDDEGKKYYDKNNLK